MVSHWVTVLNYSVFQTRILLWFVDCITVFEILQRVEERLDHNYKMQF